jgi:hypothetical protein
MACLVFVEMPNQTEEFVLATVRQRRGFAGEGSYVLHGAFERSTPAISDGRIGQAFLASLFLRRSKGVVWGRAEDSLEDDPIEVIGGMGGANADLNPVNEYGSLLRPNHPIQLTGGTCHLTVCLGSGRASLDAIITALEQRTSESRVANDRTA